MKTFFIFLGLIITNQAFAECSGGSCGVPSYSGYGYNTYYPPTYYYIPVQPQNPVTTTASQSRFRLVVNNLPPNSEIYIDGVKYPVNENQTRTFSSGRLEPGEYKYVLEIRFNDGVKEITRKKAIIFKPGDTVVLDFYSIEVVTNLSTVTAPSSQKPNFPVIPPDENRSEKAVSTEARSSNSVLLNTKKALIKFFVPENCIILINEKKWASKGKERVFTTEEISTTTDTVYHFEFIYVDPKSSQQVIERKIAIRGGESHILSLFQD